MRAHCEVSVGAGSRLVPRHLAGVTRVTGSHDGEARRPPAGSGDEVGLGQLLGGASGALGTWGWHWRELGQGADLGTGCCWESIWGGRL